MSIRNFDANDFAANPGKYTLFATARVAQTVFTENGADDLEAGQYVAVRYFRTAWNAMRRREEPVYSIITGGKVWGMMYANNLTDFCL